MRTRTITTRTITLWLASMAFVAGAHGATLEAAPVGNALAAHDPVAAVEGHAASAGAADTAANVEIDGEIDANAKGEASDLGLDTLVPVDSIPALGRLHSWSVVDNERLIIWTAPSRPYLVELFRPSPELRFAISIGVTSFGSRIHARFDSVEVDGFSYPIRRIYQLSRNEAEALRATS